MSNYRLKEVVALDSDKWYLFHISFNIVNYMLIEKNKKWRQRAEQNS